MNQTGTPRRITDTTRRVRFSNDVHSDADANTRSDSTSTIIYDPSDISSHSNYDSKEAEENGFKEHAAKAIHSSSKYSSQRQHKLVVCEECDKKVPIKRLINHLKIHDYTSEQINDYLNTHKIFIEKNKSSKTECTKKRQANKNKEKLVCKLCYKEISSAEPLKKHLMGKHLYTLKMADNYCETWECQPVPVTQSMVRNNRQTKYTQQTNGTTSMPNKLKLAVAIMGPNSEQLNEEQAMQVKQLLQEKILNEAKNPSSVLRPCFTADSIFADGALKLWCKDASTLNWLTKSVTEICTNGFSNLELKAQCEVNKKLVRATVSLPDLKNSVDEAILILMHQNENARVNTWTVLSHNTIRQNRFLAFGIPEEVIPFLRMENMSLSYNLASVKLRLY